MKRGKNKGKSGAIKSTKDLARRSPYRLSEEREIDRKIEQSNYRRKLLAKLDPETAKFAQREFAKLGLF